MKDTKTNAGCRSKKVCSNPNCKSRACTSIANTLEQSQGLLAVKSITMVSKDSLI